MYKSFTITGSFCIWRIYKNGKQVFGILDSEQACRNMIDASEAARVNSKVYDKPVTVYDYWQVDKFGNCIAEPEIEEGYFEPRALSNETQNENI